MKPLTERLRLRVISSGSCLLWTGAVNDAGYGSIRIGGRGTKLRRVHVVAWEEVHGDLPEGLVLHHECRNPACVNVHHLTPLTRAEHVRFHRSHDKHACPKGHPLDGRRATGTRFCGTCKRAWDTAAYAKRKEMAA